MTDHPLRRRDFLTMFAAGAAASVTPATITALSKRKASAGETDNPKSNTPTIDCDFPGGNVILERIEGEDVYLRQDPRDTQIFWFYWYFRVRGAGGRRLSFHFTNGNVLGVRGPATSTDGGKTWSWLGGDAVGGASFAYSFPGDVEEVRFCLAMPYQEANLREFLARYGNNPHLSAESHATTKKGRRTERLRLGELDGKPKHRVLLTCRHHSCEMMASWTLEGVMDEVLADTDTGRWLRGNVEFLVVPFIDKDGVEDGDQGKMRKPHDHNRDYHEEGIYPSVAALKEFVPRWSEGRLRLAVDMHCPYIRGGADRPGSSQRIFCVGNPSQESWRRLEEFCKILQQVQTGPLVFDPRNNLPWGQSWNTMEDTCSHWADDLPGVLFATTMEIPYADVAGQAVTIESARALGHDLARAIRRYLEMCPKQQPTQ